MVGNQKLLPFGKSTWRIPGEKKTKEKPNEHWDESSPSVRSVQKTRCFTTNMVNKFSRTNLKGLADFSITNRGEGGGIEDLVLNRFIFVRCVFVRTLFDCPIICKGRLKWMAPISSKFLHPTLSKLLTFLYKAFPTSLWARSTENPDKYRATRSSVRLFARTAHLIACSAVCTAHFARALCCAHLMTRSLTLLSP